MLCAGILGLLHGKCQERNMDSSLLQDRSCFLLHCKINLWQLHSMQDCSVRAHPGVHSCCCSCGQGLHGILGFAGIPAREKDTITGCERNESKSGNYVCPPPRGVHTLLCLISVKDGATRIEAKWVYVHATHANTGWGPDL